MLALSRMRVRSAAMTKIVGADRLAATVCPTSTLREITMPSIGEVITVFERLTRAWFSDGAGLGHGGLCRTHLRRRGVTRHLGGVELVGRDELPRESSLARGELHLGVGQRHSRAIEVRLGLDQVRLRLLDRAVIERRLEAGEHLALTDDGIEVGGERLQRFPTPGCRPERW